MAKKFKKNGNVNFNANANINAAFNGNLVIQSPNLEMLETVVNHQTGEVNHSVIFYETNKNSNSSSRVFTFSRVGPVNAGTYSVADMEADILGMSELAGATEV